jgi:ribosomal protein S18 acetylase RimI-like enzyme
MAHTITYHVMTTEMTDEVASLVTDVFLNDEPMLKALQVAPEPYLPYARFYCARYAATGLSLVARDPGGTLAGFVLCHDLTFDIFKALEEEGPSIEKETLDLLHIDGSLLDELDRAIVSQGAAQPGEYLHIVQIGIAGPFRGMGIATGLAAEAVKLGVERGFKWALSECSSDISRRSQEKCGFRAVHHIAYETYEFHGTKPFSSLPGGCTLMVKELL